MDAQFTMLLDGDLASQVRGEGIHLASMAIASGVGIVLSILTWLLRRDLKRRDDDTDAMANGILELGKKMDANKERHGYEISDIKIAVAPLFPACKLPPPEYPSR